MGDDVVIAQAEAITLAQALNMAREIGVPLGRSTLQRWAKVWAEVPGGAIKCVLLVTRTGRHYELDRDDFACWLQDQLEDQQTSAGPAGPDRVSQDPARPGEVSTDPARSAGASAGFERSHEASEGIGRQDGADDEARFSELETRVRELEDENLQLKIDVGVRRELVSKAKDELDQMRGSIEQVLKENGALEFQLRQLQAPSDHRPPIDAPRFEAQEVDNPEFGRDAMI